MGTYNEIRNLATEVSECANVSQKRLKAQRLLHTLGLPEVRRRLAAEAITAASNRGTYSVAAARRRGLAQVWRLVIRNAILAVQSIQNKKAVKFKVEDIEFPFKLLLFCDEPDDDEDVSSIYYTPRLSRTETKLVVKYCLGMLENDEALDVAESQLLQLLAYICGRREYVAYFRPFQEMQFIMEEIEKRLSPPEDDDQEPVDDDIVNKAAQVFQNLMRTTAELGFSMHIHLPGCVKMVAAWCARHIEVVSATSITACEPLLSGLTTLLRSNAEQAIAPMTRHGRAILSFAKRRFARDVSLTVISEYFTCHLYLAQVAGKLQGLMPGDLGDLGTASISIRQISVLLELVVEAVMKMGKQGRTFQWPLNAAHRTMCELIARLLACAQRLYLGKMEWNQMDDPTETLTSFVCETRTDDFLRPPLHMNTTGPCSLSLVYKSPFVMHILRKLFCLAPGWIDNAIDMDIDVPNGGQQDPNLSSIGLHPLLNVIASNIDEISADAKIVIPLLQIVSTCAEAFSLGECWMSSTLRWYRLRPVDDDPSASDIQLCVGSPVDLAAVVHVISNILELHGGPSGDHEVQRWTLLCLLRLTEASAAQSHLCRDTPNELASLRTTWRRVWSIILRPDLRYVAYTKAAREGSNGELVLLLLTEIVHQFCTDPELRWTPSIPLRQASFLRRHQSDLWSLPAFASARSMCISASFELIAAVLFNVGLSEQGSDSIPDASFRSGRRTRRHRLVLLCLQAMESPGDQQVVGSAAMCISALVHGKASSRSSTFCAVAVESLYDEILLSQTPRLSRLSFSHLQGVESDIPSHSPLLACLWGESSTDLKHQTYLQITDDITADVTGAARSRLLGKLKYCKNALESADFIPQSQSDDLLQLIRPLLRRQTRGLLETDFPQGDGDLSDSNAIGTEPSSQNDSRLSSETRSMKVTLSIMLSCQNDSVIKVLDDISDGVSHLFLRIGSNIESVLLSDEEEATVVLSDLLRIVRAIVELSTEAHIVLPGSILESASSVFGVFEDLLGGYIVGGSVEETPVSRSSTVKGDEDSLLMDDEVDDFDENQVVRIDSGDSEVRSGRKRKRGGVSGRGKKARISVQATKCPSFRCAYLLASIMIVLKPSFEVCEFVAESLLGVDSLSGSNDSTFEVDLMGGIHALHLICTKSTMLHDTAKRLIDQTENELPPAKGSVIQLMCHVIQSIRSTATLDSVLHGFGYSLCADVVRLGESRHRNLSINSDEARLIFDLLRGEGPQERRSLVLRPQLRVEQLQSVVLAFIAGKDEIRNHLMSYLPSSVGGQLGEQNGMVRRNASLTVAVAMRVLPDEDKVVESVLKRLPCLDKSSDDPKSREQYRKWYEGRGQGDVLPSTEKQAWEDALLSVEWGVVDCWSVIAGASSRSEVTSQILFDLVHLSFLRPSLQSVCFQAVERIAMASGATAEQMLESESEGLVRKWLKETGESLFDLPLLITAPSMVRRLLRAGRWTVETDEGQSSAESELDIKRLRESAATEFITRFCYVILPCIMIQSVSKMLKSSVTKDGKRRLLEDNYIKEVCSAFSDRFDDDVVKKVLRSHLPDILAFFAPLHCGSEMEKEIAAETDRLLTALLSEDTIQRSGKRGAHLALRRALQLSGKYGSEKHSNGESADVFEEAVNTLAVRFGGSVGDVFVRLGSSSTECLLFGKLWLEKSFLDTQKKQRWSALRLVCRLIVIQLRENARDNLQLGFCLYTLSDLLLNADMDPVRPLVVDALIEIIEEATSRRALPEKVRIDLARAARELLAVCMHVHERYQETVVNKSSSTQREREAVLKRSLGILGYKRDEPSDTWGWDGHDDIVFGSSSAWLKTFVTDHTEKTVSTIIGTSRVLKLILDSATSIGLKSDDLVGVCPPYEVDSLWCDALSGINTLFSAQNFVRHFLDSESLENHDMHVDEPAILRRLRDTACSIGESSFATFRTRPPTNETPGRVLSISFSIDQRLLRAELVQLQRFLHHHRIKSNAAGELSLRAKEVNVLVRELLSYCGVHYSDQVRMAASRCLGEMDMDLVQALAAPEPHFATQNDWIDTALRSERLSLTLKARAIEVLAKSLKVSDTGVAILAMETLKALLASGEGDGCRDLVQDADTRSLLDAFVSTGRSLKGTSLVLTEKEIHEIKVVAKIAPTTTCSLWCWEQELWRYDEGDDFSFEQWICCLVPALLVCCYGETRKEKSKSDTSNEFFSLCQRMSRFEPAFAVALFPSIVLDLLQNSKGSDVVEGVLGDTWIGRADSAINVRLSSCFTVLLTACNSDGGDDGPRDQAVVDSRPIDLVVDTLDLLRRLTQYRFHSSKGHKRNPMTLSAASGPGDQRTSRPSQEVLSERSEYTEDLVEAPPWKGVPFGIVLKLDGLLIAHACIKAKRFASALFYSEMHADARFRGSTRVLGDLSTEDHEKLLRHCTSDVSGFEQGTTASHDDEDTDSALALLRDSQLSFLNVQRKCFLQLGEEEARRVVDRQCSDLRFVGNHESTGLASLEGELSPSLQHLQLLDNVSSLERQSRSTNLATADCLERLGLRNTLQSYIAGLVADDPSVFTDGDLASLKERWFECRLYDLQWEDCDIRDEGDPSRMSHDFLTDTSSSSGFHEWTVKALDSLKRDDSELCSVRLAQARHELLDEVSQIGREMSIDRTFIVLDRLQALNDLDAILSGTESFRDILIRWKVCGTEDTDEHNNQNILCLADDRDCGLSAPRDFSECVREIALRSIYTKAVKSNRVGVTGALDHLASQLWRISSINCELGRHNVAEGALQRLYSLLRSNGAITHRPADISTLFRLRLQEARLLESKGDFSGAIRLAKQTVKHIREGVSELDQEPLLADALVTCGRWMTKHKVEPANSILDAYLRPGSNFAMSVYEKEESEASRRGATTGFLALSELASSLFETVNTRTKSLEWQKSGQRIDDRKAELEKCDKLFTETKKRCEKSRKRGKSQSKETAKLEAEVKEISIYRTSLNRELGNAQSERKKIQESMGTYQNLALRSLVSALTIADVGDSDDISRHVYRMISLWFSSTSDAGLCDEVDVIMEEAVEGIPSFRFVPLASQLFARLQKENPSSRSLFQIRLQQLVLKMCRDHPYHCLVPMIALSNGKKVGTGVSGRDLNAFLENTSDAKVETARDIIALLKKKEESSFISHLIENYEKLADAYIHLAMADVTDFHRSLTKKIPFNAVCKGTDPQLDRCMGRGSRSVDYPPCILTKPPTLRPGCDYGDGVRDPIGTERVVGFDTHFSITDGGIHRPKIVVCIGSQGGRFKQLVKGEDEIRQDAVMQQVFGYVNELMTRRHRLRGDDTNSHPSSSSNCRNAPDKGLLKVVTYNIVPLNPAAGVLEWVEDTIPLGEYIQDKGTRRSGYVIGAHSRYYPGEWNHTLCRDFLKGAPPDAKREAFDAVCDHFSPAFRFFFVERFGHSMEAWHEAKMRYTRSVAVTSIVGHVLGIGDRHTSNILVHEKTGEVVHIDFGIVFEQGKCLNTPEKVPFRLTRNIVDGMGPLGTEGTFTSAAEATLRALKRDASALLTILSAIVADPLYKWSVSPVKARERQRLSEKNGDVAFEDEENRDSAMSAGNDIGVDENEAATHAITKINEKLQGYEDGTSGEQQSVEGQVQLLINSARDHDNLSCMFAGWAPWI